MSFDSEYRELFVDEKVKELREFVDDDTIIKPLANFAYRASENLIDWKKERFNVASAIVNFMYAFHKGGNDFNTNDDKSHAFFWSLYGIVSLIEPLKEKEYDLSWPFNNYDRFCFCYKECWGAFQVADLNSFQNFMTRDFDSWGYQGTIMDIWKEQFDIQFWITLAYSYKEMGVFVEERWDQLRSLYAGSECYVQISSMEQ